MRALAAALAGILTAAILAVPTSAAAGPPPLPEDDPWFAAPADLADHAPGDIIATRPVRVKAFELPVPADAWQLKYRMNDRRERASVGVTTLIVPKSAWRKGGSRPVVSYQTAEDGVSTRCAPSYALTAGLSGGFTGSYSETPIIVSALLQGWAVSVPDYEGQESQFLVADVAAHHVLDGLRAARAFADADLAESPLAMWGYSGGAFATANAAQLQKAYAPELPVEAIALGGLLSDVRATIDAFDGSIGGGAVPMGMHGFDRAYPQLDIPSYLNDLGRRLFEDMAADCIFDAVPKRPFLRVDQIEAFPDALDTPRIARMLRANSPMHRPGLPTAPVYEYHTVLDQFAPIEPVREHLKQYCRGGVDVHHDPKLIGEHLTEIALGVPGALSFLKRSFDGKAPRNTCGSIR